MRQTLLPMPEAHQIALGAKRAQKRRPCGCAGDRGQHAAGCALRVAPRRAGEWHETAAPLLARPFRAAAHAWLRRPQSSETEIDRLLARALDMTDPEGADRALAVLLRMPGGKAAYVRAAKPPTAKRPAEGSKPRAKRQRKAKA